MFSMELADTHTDTPPDSLNTIPSTHVREGSINVFCLKHCFVLQNILRFCTLNIVFTNFPRVKHLKKDDV